MPQLLHRWFVQYNPLYFASALFVLLGAFLVTRDPLDWANGQLGLAGLIQLYELALIGAAAFLFRLPGQRRPAVILGIVALAFLFDVTFRSEGLASVGTHIFGASVLWAALVPVKLALIARALRVRFPVLHTTVWTLAALMLALGPQLIGGELADRAIVLAAACWVGIALVALAFSSRPQPRLRVALDDWGRIVLARIAAVTPLGWAALYWAHIAVWCGVYDLRLTPVCFAPAALLVPFLVRSEAHTWILCALVLALGAGAPIDLRYLALLIGAGLALKAEIAGMPRLYIAAVAAAYLAVPNWLAPPLWVSAATSGVLLFVAWRYRLRSALVAACFFAAPAALPWLPAKAGQWGAVLLAAGFCALGAGVALNWWAASGHAPRRLPLNR